MLRWQSVSGKRYMKINADDFRKALGNFAAGVTVVTGKLPNGAPAGLTVTAFSSVSLEPPLVMVCIGKQTGCLDAFEKGDAFAVNLLSEDQQELSNLFAKRDADKFAGLDIESGETGCPLIKGSLAQIECRKEAVHEAGDHFIYIGRIVSLKASDEGKPLLYFRGAYQSMADA